MLDATPPPKMRGRPHLTGVISAAVLTLAAACSSPAHGQQNEPAPTAIPSSSTPSPTGTSQGSGDSPGSLSISTPIPPAASLDGSSAPTPTAPPARVGQAGVTQRHTFAPTSITLYPRHGNVASAAVQTIDTTGTGELSLPKDPGQVGWWQSGALAGDAFGSVVLAGHIDSRDQGIGFFIRLLHVQPSDEVLLSDATYQQRYRVVSTREIPKASLATSTDTFLQHVPGHLVLLTCTGRYDPTTHYPDNLVVTADPIGIATPRS